MTTATITTTDLRRRTRQRGLRLAAKRAIDIVGACVLLALTWPVMAAAAVAVKLDSSGPVLYRQRRVGRFEQEFEVLKLRSMRVDTSEAEHRRFIEAALRGEAAQEHFKVQADPRITRVGRVIRRTSIDELPQLVNVLRGEMSLVGPRPDVPYAVARYRPEHRRRFDVLPGMTGLWQVSGRSRLSPTEMLDLDVRYVEQWSLRQDVVLLWRTVPEVLRIDRSG